MRNFLSRYNEVSSFGITGIQDLREGNEITTIAYETWIASIKVEGGMRGELRLTFPTDFNKSIFQMRYLPIIKRTLAEKFQSDLEMEFIVKDNTEHEIFHRNDHVHFLWKELKSSLSDASVYPKDIIYPWLDSAEPEIFTSDQVKLTFYNDYRLSVLDVDLLKEICRRFSLALKTEVILRLRSDDVDMTISLCCKV